MTISIFLARIFSIYMLVMGLVVLTRRVWLQEIINEFFTNKAMLFLSAVVALILGTILIVLHPQFTPDWRSLISLFAWLTFIKGIAYLFFQEKVIAWKNMMLRYTQFYYVLGLIIILVSLYLGYYGFFAYNIH